MKIKLPLALLLTALATSSAPAGPALTGFPFTEETLNYSINWPSGLSLGEAHMRASHSASGEWNLELTMDAALPGFAVSDRYKAVASNDLCTVTFSKHSAHGSRIAKETTQVDGRSSVATRATEGGGKSDIPVPACVRDALTFIYYARRELGQGRVPAAQLILFGAAYQGRMDYTGGQVIRMNEAPVQTDRLICTLKGPTSNIKFEAFFARDAARTPLLFRTAFSMGAFSMELIR